MSLSSSTVPIPPRDILRRFIVDEPFDTRFQSCARLMQSIWRQRRGFPAGEYLRPGEMPLKLGSRLASSAARAGFNYLQPETARLVRRELAYRERGALIDEARVWENLLSSAALVFNLFAPLKLDFLAAKSILNSLLPLDIASVTAVRFESSPGRGDERFIGDGTAFDVTVAYVAKDGANCFLGIEVKYSESSPTSATPVKPRLVEVAELSQMFINAKSAALQRPPLRQFYAEHSLCYSLVHEHREFDRGRFIVIAPSLNHEMSAAIHNYRNQLAESGSKSIPFDVVSLERLVGAMADNGLPELARSLDERYLNFDPIFDLIDDWEPHVDLAA